MPLFCNKDIHGNIVYGFSSGAYRNLEYYYNQAADVPASEEAGHISDFLRKI